MIPRTAVFALRAVLNREGRANAPVLGWAAGYVDSIFFVITERSRRMPSSGVRGLAPSSVPPVARPALEPGADAVHFASRVAIRDASPRCAAESSRGTVGGPLTKARN